MTAWSDAAISFSFAASLVLFLLLLGNILSNGQNYQSSLALYEECEVACSPLQPALVEVNSFSSDEETCFCIGKKGNLRKQNNLEYLD